MKTLKINAKKRIDLGKKSSKLLREQEQVPCVMYGGEEIIHFHAHVFEFKNLVYSNHVHLAELDIDGQAFRAVMKDIQFHPVSDAITHIDFVQVTEKKPTTVALPITLSGASVGVLAGGKIRQRRRYLKAKALIKDMPEVLDIDITNLNIGSTIKVSDLSFKNIELLDPSQAMVVGVISSRVAAKGMELESDKPAAAEAPAEEKAEA
jgi:large subunit ribosomal protein L25